jgi:hypothetical protein
VIASESPQAIVRNAPDLAALEHHGPEQLGALELVP